MYSFFLGITICLQISPTATPAAASAPAQMSQEQLEQRFAETLSGTVLTGSFTTDEQEVGDPIKRETYTIHKVRKLKGNLWLFSARIQYGKKDVTLPIPLTVRWAGDTPVITLTDLTIPGLGTFTARVMIYRGRYAGTWQHGSKGGHLFGTVAKAKSQPHAGAPTATRSE